MLAASSCQLLSFLAVAARARIDVVSYEDDATGEMPDGRYPWVERIVLRPVVQYRGDTREERVPTCSSSRTRSATSRTRCAPRSRSSPASRGCRNR